MLLLASAMLVVTLSAAPLIETNEWWIRIWDYPRVQLLAVGSVILVALACFLRRERPETWTVFLFLVAALAFQAWRIAPYTPLGTIETALARSPENRNCASVLVANVYMENRRTEALERMIRERKPSIVLLLENDAWWSRQLDEIKQQYRHVIDRPQSNTYGLLFMTDLERESIELRFLSSESIPSIRADLKLPSGAPVRFYGVHPEPPRVAQDSDQRDVELMLVAKEIRDFDGRVLVGGDLNDVAWSHTTRLFKRVSRTLDPRRGRGLYSSFHAEYPLLRWPLDHLFHTEDFEISYLEVLPYTGSDHFPVTGQFCLKGDAEDNRTQERMTSGDREDMRETIENRER